MGFKNYGSTGQSHSLSLPINNTLSHFSTSGNNIDLIEYEVEKILDKRNVNVSNGFL